MQNAQKTELSAQLAAASVAELLQAYLRFNATLFHNALLPPQLGLSKTIARFGQWVPHTRSLLLSEKLVETMPWGAVLEVLKHEMAHQYVHEILGRGDETAHGPTFRLLCDRLGIDKAAHGLPPTQVANPEGTQAAKRRRIARLLSLAESPNLHEAESAMQKAHSLLLKYNLELQTEPQPRYGFRHLGQPRTRIDEHLRLVAMVLGRYFFVETIWVPSFEVNTGQTGQVLEVIGRPENLEMAAYVYEFLLHSAQRLWEQHQQMHPSTHNRERRTFLAGVMLGFAKRLQEQHQTEAQQGLVLCADRGVAHMLRQRHPRIRQIRSRGQPRTQARTAGQTAGERLVLHKPLVEHVPNAGAGRGLQLAE